MIKPFIFLNLVWLGLLVNSCDADYDRVSMLMQDTIACTDRSENIEVIYSDSGIIRARIFSPLVERYENDKGRYMEMKKGMRAYFYNDLRQMESSLSSGYGISYDERKIIEVRNNVEVINTAGEKLNTEKLIWNQQTRMIYTDEPVKITRGNEVLLGEGFESNQNFTEWKIKRPRGSFKLENETGN